MSNDRNRERGAEELRGSSHPTSAVKTLYSFLFPIYNIFTRFNFLHNISIYSKMSGPGAGFEYPPQEVSWLKRDVLLFANSIGCTADELHFLYVRLHEYISRCTR
jgi:hypothetical protein